MVPIKIFFIAAFAGILIANGSTALGISSDELIEKAKDYDGKFVTYSGEVIGDIMRRGDNAWINVSDGKNAIGIWLPFDETKKIKYTGKYQYKGDMVKVEGIFNRACSKHGGDLDIHSQKFEVIKKGYKVPVKINFINILIAGILFVFAVGLSLIIYKKRM